MTAIAGTTFIYPFIPFDQLLWTIIYNSTILRQPDTMELCQPFKAILIR
jgi:hypothetical protein